MKDWFDSLESREQIFVAMGAVIVVVALIYALLWLPLDKCRRLGAFAGRTRSVAFARGTCGERIEAEHGC